MKRVAFFDPYLNILGGGERYMLTMAQHLSSRAKVDIFWHKDIKAEILARLNINLERTTFLPYKKNILKKIILLRKYDVFIYITDGSLFWSSAKKNILIIQSPAHIPSLTNIYQQAKLSQWKTILCYSRFVGRFIEMKLKRKPIVLPPPVEIDLFKPGKKENIILSTGRFFSHLHSKKQDFLVDVFIKLYRRGITKKWQLVLIGSVIDDSAQLYLDKVRKKASNFPIKIITNAPFSLLRNYYSKAKIFWLATGYGQNLKKFPERAEHFGIVTIEAMAAGCVPLVFAAGGQLEIVDHGKDGYLFHTEEELSALTANLIKNQHKLPIIARKGRQKSKNFAKEVFLRRLDEII